MFNENYINKIRVLELCSGIGMTSIALNNACNRLGIEMDLVAFSEIDKKAIEGYHLLHGKVPNLGDVTKASFGGINCDIVLFTSPCTSLSLVGKKDGFEEGSNTPSSIIWHVKRVINELDSKPPIIFFENVKAMTSKRYSKDFELLIAYLKSEGYSIKYKVLDAQDHCIPQHRERLYIICSLMEVNFEFPSKEPLLTRLSDILDKDVDEKYYHVNKDYYIRHSLDTSYTFKVHNPSYASVAQCITTLCGNRIGDNFIFAQDVSQEPCVYFKEKKLLGYDLQELSQVPIRKLTRSECMKLMGMSEEDIAKLSPISDSQIFKQMGNGIVIPIVEKIFYNFLEKCCGGDALG